MPTTARASTISRCWSLLMIVATVMSREQPKVIPVAYAMIGICFITGATRQILTHHPLY
jgi:hypothetical protein